MKPRHILHVSLALLLVAGRAPAESAATPPPVIERYEQILVKSPEKGTAFDKVYQYYFENEGLEKLAQRWKTGASAAEGSQEKMASYKILMGMLAERQGKAAEARASYTEAARMLPGNWRVWRALGDVEASDGKLPAAIDAFGKALAANPPATERATLYRLLARAQQRNLDSAGALATWQKMAAEYPDDPFVIEEVADALLDAEKYDEARATFTKLRTLAGTDPFKKVTATIRLAQVEERQGKIKEALAAYESALPQASETSWIHRDVRSRIEEVYRRQDDLPGLVAYYEKWLATHEKDVEAATRLSTALVELNRKADAVAWIQKAAEWAPDRRELKVELAKMLRDTNQAEAALQILTALTQASPEELSYWELLGATEWSLSKKGGDETHKKAALAAWQKLAPATTKDANQVARLADILRENGLTDEALAELARASTLAPDASDLRERHAAFLFELKRDDEAWKALDGLVEGARATAPNYQRLAAIQAKYGKLDAALESVKKGIALAPADYALLALQWRIFSEQNAWDDAAALYEPMLSAAPAMYEQTDEQYLQALKAAGKLETVQKSLLDKLPQATEAQVRLLTRIALQSDDLPAAKKALDEGRQRFAQSFPLAQLESTWAKRSGNLEERVAALRRLISLEPKQTGDFLQEIGRAYMEQQKWEQAQAAAQEWIAYSPANAAAHLFAADISNAAGNADESIAKLRDAVRLSEKPNQIRLRLAQAYSQKGEIDKARQAAEEAFETEEDASVKLGMLRQLSEYYLLQGKIDTLINRFRERQRSEEGGWRYAVYLSEIFQQMQDYGQAREELAKSLASRPKDPALLRQLLRLAEQENNTAEQARYQRILAEAEPTTENLAALSEALANSGDTEAATKILLEHEADLLKDPTPWRMALVRIQKQPGASNLYNALENALRQRPDDFRGRMTLAELQIAAGDAEQAKRTLWDLRRMPKPAASAAPSPTPAATAASGPMYAFGFRYGGAPTGMQKRLFSANMAQQAFQQLVTSQNSYGFGYRRYTRFGMFGYGMPTTPAAAASFEESRDKALVYLAAIAVREQKAEAFLAELEKDLGAQNADRLERFVCYSMVQARDLLWREIKAQAESPTGGDELDQLCLNTLPQYIMQRPGTTEAEAKEASEMMQKISERLAKSDPGKTFSAKMTRYSMLNNAGKKDEAQKIADEIVASIDETDTMQLQCAFSIHSDRGDIEKAEKLLPKIVEVGKKNNRQMNFSYLKFSLAQAYLKKKDIANGARLIAENFRDSLPAQVGGVSGNQMMFFGSGYRSFYRGNYQPQVPYPNRYMDDQRLNALRQAHQLLKPLDGMKAFHENLAKLELPDEMKIYTRLASVYLEWLDNDKETAFQDAKAIASETADDELRLLAAGMASELNKQPEAIALLEQVGSQQRDIYKRAQQILLACAKKSKEDEMARKAVLRLVSLRPPREELSQLLPDLKRLGLSDKAGEIEKQIATSGNQPNDLNRKAELLNTYLRDKKTEEALGLAKALLALDPFATQNTGDYYRHRSLEALKELKALEGYIADLEKQAAATPDSARICLLLAEAWSKQDNAKASEWYRKVAALRPADTAMQWKMVQQMNNRDQRDEAIKLAREIIQKNPDIIFESRFDVSNIFENAKALPELAELVLQQKAQPRTPSLGYNPGNRQPEWLCQNLGQRLRDPGNNLELAVKVWKKGLELADENNPHQSLQLRGSLVKGLADLGQKEEALQQVEALYFPPPPPKTALLGMNTYYNNSSWMNSTSSDGSGNVSYPGLEPLDVAEKLGNLAALRAKAEEKAAKDDAMKCLVLIIRARQRDPELLKDLPKLLAEPAPTRGMGLNNDIFLRVLSGDLARWPEAKRLSLDVLFAAGKIVESYQGNPTYQAFGIQMQIFNRAIEFNESEVARKAAKQWIGLLKSSPNGPNSFGGGDMLLNAMRSMLKAGMSEECADLLAFMKEDLRNRNDSYMRRQVAEFEPELQLAKGEISSPQAIVCPAIEANGNFALLWEIRPGKAESDDLTQASFLGYDLPKLDGRWNLELLAMTPPNKVTRIALIPKAKARGKWSGPLPPGLLTIQAVLRPATAKKEEGSSFQGQWTPFLGGTNLIVNPTFEGIDTAVSATTTQVQGWLQAPSGSIKPGGPVPGGRQVELRFPNNNQSKLMSEKIPVEKGRDYLFSIWSRADNYININMRFFDQDGKNISSDGLNGNPLRGRWCYGSRVFSTNGGRNRSRIPDKAVAMQLWMEASGTVSLCGLSLTQTELPPPESTPTPSPTPSPSASPSPKSSPAAATAGESAAFALACPAGEENGKSVIQWEIRTVDPKHFNPENRLFDGTVDTKLDGRYNLELIYASRPNAVQRLALIPAAKAAGKWSGKLPPGLGTIQAVLHPSGKTTGSAAQYTGSWVPVVNAPNLIANPRFEAENPTPQPATDASPAATGTASPTPTPAPVYKGWENLPTVALQPESPHSPGGYVLFSNPNKKNTVTVLGEKIPVNPDKDYTISAWTLYTKGSYPRIGLRMLDKEGKELRKEYAGTPLSVKGKWSFRYMTVTTGGTSDGRRNQTARNTAFLQPYIEVREDLGVDCLHLGETDAPAARNPDND